jgi:hypothetical protein
MLLLLRPMLSFNAQLKIVILSSMSRSTGSVLNLTDSATFDQTDSLTPNAFLKAACDACNLAGSAIFPVLASSQDPSF